MQTIDGKKIREEILLKIKKEVTSLKFVPVFCDVLVGDDPVSAQYVRMKGRMAEKLGIKFHSAHFEDSINENELKKEIKKIVH